MCGPLNFTCHSAPSFVVEFQKQTSARLSNGQSYADKKKMKQDSSHPVFPLQFYRVRTLSLFGAETPTTVE
jgi:hypothetical protein